MPSSRKSLMQDQPTDQLPGRDFLRAADPLHDIPTSHISSNMASMWASQSYLKHFPPPTSHPSLNTSQSSTTLYNWSLKNNSTLAPSQKLKSKPSLGPFKHPHSASYPSLVNQENSKSYKTCHTHTSLEMASHQSIATSTLTSSQAHVPPHRMATT